LSVNKTAGDFARYLATELKMSSARQEVLAYGLELILLGLLGLAVVALGGCLVGAPLEALAVLLASSLLRLPGGGMHLSSPLKCLAFTAAVFSGLGYLCKGLSQHALFQQNLALLVILSGFLSLAVSLLMVPVINPAKPIHSPELKFKLRRGAIAVSVALPAVLLLALERWPSLALSGAVGLIWQDANMCLMKTIQRGGG